MLLSINWLKQFIDISDLTLEDIENKLVKAGFEVEGIETIGAGTNLVVGKVLECKDHPDSDHLHITKVDIGNEVLDIVCGAPNCRQGLKVIVAKVGAKLPGGEIKAGVIRGEASNGMLCSLLELGVSKDLLPDNSPSLNGIEELSDDFEIGEEGILDKLGYHDTIFDISIYANRPDCLSVFAICKEIGAILNKKCVLPVFEGKANIGSKSSFTVTSNSKNCTHFLAKVVNKVTIKPSPKWIQEYLRANGIKTINNLVDISNIVMLETGQPLHFYDLRSNPNRNITVVDDYEGNYLALDDIEYQIEKGDLMITSDNKPIGIAGIMGGDATKILDDTTGLIIEAALFDHAQIRRTSNRLGLQTDAAARFSKGLEPLAQNKAMDRAVELLIEYADATDFEETVEYGDVDYVPYEIEETIDHLNALIGKEYTIDEAVDVMKRLDFKTRVDGHKFYVEIPSYRSFDLKIREDLDEEIVRLTDFDSLQSTLPLMPQTVGRLSNVQRLRRTIRDLLTNASLNEICSYTLVDQKYIDNACLPLGEAISVLSPLSDQRKYIRNSLMNSLLETLSYNLDHNNENVNLFEISSVYAKDLIGERLGIVLNGNLLESKVLHLKAKADFYTIKGLVFELLQASGFAANRIQIIPNEVDTKHFHPYQSCILKMGDNVVAILGKIHPAYAQTLKISDTYYAEIMINELINQTPSKIKAPILNKYPAISRDISIVVKDDVTASELIKAAKKAGGKLVKSIEIFDIYKGEHIAEGFKSVSLNIIYESIEKTLKVEDINPIHEKILSDLNKIFEANLR